MSRNTHHRVRDHFGEDFTENILTSDVVGGDPAGSNLQNVLENLASGLTTAGLSVVMDSTTGLIVGVKGWVEVPFPAVITAARIFADQTTNTVVDIWKTSYANHPGSAANSICAATKPTLSAATKAQNTTLTGWTTTITAGDILTFTIDSNSAARRLTVALTLSKTA